MATNPYQLLIFDWDGTLFDSIGSIVACTLAALDDLGLDGLSEEAIRSTIGLGLKETLDVLFPGGDAVLLQRVRETYFHHWPSFRERPGLFPGASETLARLGERGYLLAVATGKGRFGLELDMRRSGTGHLFVSTRTVDEAPSKPHPGMVLDLLGELGVRPHEALVVGDTTYDLEMARNAGTPALGVTSGSHSQELLEGAGPLACLGSVNQLEGWLEKKGASPSGPAPP